MYIHLGDGIAVRDRSIVGIFDLDNTTVGKDTKSFLKKAQDEGQMIDASEDIPKAYVVAQEYGMDKIYLTQMAAATIEKRIKK